MAQAQIIICNDEDGYQRNLVMWEDPTLTEDDILSLGYNGIPADLFDDIYNNSLDGNFPIVICPVGWDARLYARHCVEWEKLYPNVPVVLPYQKEGQNAYSYPTLPVVADVATGRKSPIIIAGAGDVDSSLGTWWKSNAIEFIADGREFIPNPINHMSQHATGVIKVGSSQWSFGWYFFAVGTPIHITGVTGFANNPSGWYQISENIDDTYVLINGLTLGAGALGGTPVASTTFLSDTVGIVGAKLNKIKKLRAEEWGSCTWWEARHCARVTGSSGGRSDGEVGYGLIDVDLAVDIDLGSNPADPDPYITLGSVGTLTGTYDANTKKMTFVMPRVDNALYYELIENPNTGNEKVILSQPLLTPTQMYEPVAGQPDNNPTWNDALEELTFIHKPVTLGTVTYKYRGVRYSEQGTLSNAVTSTIPELVVTKQQRFDVNDSVWVMKQGILSPLRVVAHERVIDNPNNDDVGIVTDYYTLEDGLVYPDSKLGVTKNHLLYKQNGTYLNGELGYEGYVYDPYSVTVEDLCGLNLRGADLSAMILSDFHFDGINLTDAILPPEIVSKSLFRSSVRGYDATTTIYTDGTELGTG